MKKTVVQKAKHDRKMRSDKGHPQLTQRDEDMLQHIGEQTAYRFDQLQGLLARHPDTQAQNPTALSETRTREIINRWKALDLVVYQKIHYDTPGWISLTRKGLYHFNLPLHFINPRYSDLDHFFWINETRVLIEETYGSRLEFQWESERQYRARHEHYKIQLKHDADLLVPYEYRGSHRPDALLRYRLKDDPNAYKVVSALEIELSEKDYATWKKIFLELTQHYTNAHYYVSPGVKSSLTKALEKFRQEEPAFGETSTERRQYIYIHDLEQLL